MYNRKVLTRDFYLYLDALRYLFSAVVVVAHIFQIFVLPKIGLDFLPWYVVMLRSCGSISVVGFFILSGFVIAGSLKNRDDTFSFLKKRISRIIPPLWGGVVFSAAIWAIVTMCFKVDNLNHLGNLYLVRPDLYDVTSQWMKVILFFPGSSLKINGALWSISFEVYCYLLFLILYCFWSCREYMLFGFMVCLLFLLSIFSIDMLVVLSFFLSFLCGVFWYNVHSFYIRRKRVFLICGFGLAAAFVCVWILYSGSFLHYFLRINQVYDLMSFIFQFLISILMMLCMVALSFIRKNFLFDFFAKQSKYSYSMYCIHFPILIFFAAIAVKVDFLNVYWYVLMFLLISIVSYFFAFIFEKKTFYYRLIFIRDLKFNKKYYKQKNY